jgi:hypothetical protein
MGAVGKRSPVNRTSWHPFESAKTHEIGFRALLTGGAYEMELALV